MDEYHLPDSYRNIVVEVMQESLETIAFMEVISSAAFSPYDESLKRKRAEILIHDPIPGEIILVMPESLVLIIAENVYALEEAKITDELMDDLIAEMINVIAGNLMRKIIPDDQSFQLGLPAVGRNAYLEIKKEINRTVQFDMEGEAFWMVLRGPVFDPSRIEHWT
ncbi:chemotaxis protein CheX [Deltaproteobacteria bacterium TL4]